MNTENAACPEPGAAGFHREAPGFRSISGVMAAVGHKKEGIYHHFESKEQLVLEVVDDALGRVRRCFIQAIRS